MQPVFWNCDLVTYAIAAAGVVGIIALILAWMILPTALYLELCALELGRSIPSATSRAIGTAVPDAL